MAKRFYTRIPVHLEGEIIAHGARCKAFITNISEYGLYARVPLAERERHNNLASCINVKLQLPNDESVDLDCTKRWAFQTSPGSLIENVGIEIIDPPQQYKEFCWALMILRDAL